MTNLEFSVGKLYRTRDGRKAQIFMLDNGEGYMFGVTLENEGIWVCRSWNNTTGFWSRHTEHRNDLVHEWREPRKISTEVWISPVEVVADSHALLLRMGFNSYDLKKYGSCTVKARITLEEIPDDAY